MFPGHVELFAYQEQSSTAGRGFMMWKAKPVSSNENLSQKTIPGILTEEKTDCHVSLPNCRERP